MQIKDREVPSEVLQRRPRPVPNSLSYSITDFCAYRNAKSYAGANSASDTFPNATTFASAKQYTHAGAHAVADTSSDSPSHSTAHADSDTTPDVTPDAPPQLCTDLTPITFANAITFTSTNPFANCFADVCARPSPNIRAVPDSNASSYETIGEYFRGCNQ